MRVKASDELKKAIACSGLKSGPAQITALGAHPVKLDTVSSGAVAMRAKTLRGRWSLGF